ncbi:MAG TPA: hypothetical protein VIP70_07765 [Nitrososphaeraceae archaeon]
MSRITKEDEKKERGKPYVYLLAVIIPCFIVRLWFRLDSNNALDESWNWIFILTIRR